MKGIFRPPRAEDTRRTRSREMKLDKFDGTADVDTFLAKFEICARHNEWGEKERLAQLRYALINDAAQILWDMGSEEVASSSELISQLRLRYGAEQQTALYRTQLKCRRRTKGESLGTLVHDIRRMVALAYPGPTSSIKEAVACDAFLDALNDPEMALKVREREPPSLEEAFQIALRLEAYAGSGVAGSSKESDKDWRGHFRATRAVPVKVSNDRRWKNLRGLGRRQQESSRQMLKEVKGMAAGTGSSQTETAWESSISTMKSSSSSNPARPAWRSRGPRRPVRVTCFKCGETGHFRNQCPNKHSADAEIPGPPAQGTSACTATNHHVKRVNRFYINVKIGRKVCRALIDTGSETTLVPYAVVDGVRLEPSDQQLQAANGTTIVVRGGATLPLQVGPVTVSTKCLVVEGVTEVLIGMGWLLEERRLPRLQESADQDVRSLFQIGE